MQDLHLCLKNIKYPILQEDKDISHFKFCEKYIRIYCYVHKVLITPPVLICKMWTQFETTIKAFQETESFVFCSEWAVRASGHR